MLAINLSFAHQRPSPSWPLSFSAVVEAPGSAWRIDRQAFEVMATKDPFSLALLQQVVLRSTCLSAAHAREALEHASHAN